MGRRVALVVHPTRHASLEVAERAAVRLLEQGCDVVLGIPPRRSPHPDHAPVMLHEPPPTVASLTRVGPDEAVAIEGTDLAIAFGGDGTFLRAAHLCQTSGVPLIGVNVGRLGFLAELEIEGLDEAVDAIVEGRYQVTNRQALAVVCRDADGALLDTGWAMNEVSIEKTARQRVLDLALRVGGTHLAQVPADAVVVATPTGSTAYSFSAGGPILSPDVPALLVTPVAPHSLFARTLIAGPQDVVEVHVLPDQEPAVVSCDGREPIEVPAGGTVEARLDGAPLRLARVHPADFWDRVHRKFGLR